MLPDPTLHVGREHPGKKKQEGRQCSFFLPFAFLSFVSLGLLLLLEFTKRLLPLLLQEPLPLGLFGLLNSETQLSLKECNGKPHH